MGSIKLLVQTYNVHLFPPWIAQFEACFAPQSYLPDTELRFQKLTESLRL